MYFLHKILKTGKKINKNRNLNRPYLFLLSKGMDNQMELRVSNRGGKNVFFPLSQCWDGGKVILSRLNFQIVLLILMVLGNKWVKRWKQEEQILYLKINNSTLTYKDDRFLVVTRAKHFIWYDPFIMRHFRLVGHFCFL